MPVIPGEMRLALDQVALEMMPAMAQLQAMAEFFHAMQGAPHLSVVVDLFHAMPDLPPAAPLTPVPAPVPVIAAPTVVGRVAHHRDQDWLK